jgi:hypothetical protein
MSIAPNPFPKMSFEISAGSIGKEGEDEKGKKKRIKE